VSATNNTGLGIVGSLTVVCLLAFTPSAFPADSSEPKSTRMTCGSCPSGYAKTGVTSAPGICKEGDPTLVECVPLGTMNLMAVCGSCPDGYREIGSSSVPARCGSADGGHMSQCQLEKFENVLPDPKGGGRFCPPDCTGQLPTPGQGALPPPAHYRPPPQEKK
jgi:hypothetical protein